MKKLCLLLATVLCTGFMFTVSACSQIDIVGSVYEYEEITWQWTASASKEEKDLILGDVTEEELTDALCGTFYYILCSTRFVILDSSTLMFGLSDAMVMLSYSRNGKTLSLDMPSGLIGKEGNMTCSITADSLVMGYNSLEGMSIPISTQITYKKHSTTEAPNVAGKTFKASSFESAKLLENMPASVLEYQTNAHASVEGGIAAYIAASGAENYDLTTEEGVKTVTFGEDGTYTQVMTGKTYTGKYFISGNYVYAYMIVNEADVPISLTATPATSEAPDEVNIKACVVSTYYMVEGNLKQIQIIPEADASFSAVFAYTEVVSV